MEAQDVMMTWQKMEPGMKEAVLISGSLVLVIFLILIWAIFLRKPSRHNQSRHDHRQHRRYRSPEPQGQPAGMTDDAAGPSKRRRWRRRRREHRPRNPTLSETGGLPPFRSEGPPSPMT